MAPGHTEPLSFEDWKRLVENLERGPTPKQIEIMEEAEKRWGKDVRDMMAGRTD